MPTSRSVIAVAVAVTLSAMAGSACGEQRPAGIEYRASGLVVEKRTANAGNAVKGPQLCLGAVASIRPPPACDGLEVAEWDWDTVDGEESEPGITWGRYDIVGTIDGNTFALTRPARKPAPVTSDSAGFPRLPSLASPCSAPAGGWKPGDRDGVPEGIPSGLERSLRRNSDVSAVWIDPNRGDGILNVRYARDTARYAPALRRAYPGNLCLTTGGRARDELRDLFTRLSRDVATANPSTPKSNRLGGWVEEIGGHVFIEVIVDPGGQIQRSADRRAGPKVVTVLPVLRPLSP